MKSETIQLVTMELVIGKIPNFVNSSETKLTPSPAAKTDEEDTKKGNTIKGVFKSKFFNYKFKLS